MVAIHSGSFMMGGNEYYHQNQKPIHPVTVSYEFQIGQYEVTQAQWQSVMGNNPSSFKSYGANCPVEKVSWNDVQTFIQKINQLTGKQYRLPTEAEWEYACRAGTGDQYAYCGGNNIDQVAWYDKNSNNTTHPVGQKAPNAWGLYDMTGNVREWVQDNYHDNFQGAPDNAKQAWEGGVFSNSRMSRGSAWYNYAHNSHVAVRDDNYVPLTWDFLGFRLARTLP